MSELVFDTSMSHILNIVFLLGLPKYKMTKLQKIQNAAARVVTKSKHSDSKTPRLKWLLWLPVQERMNYEALFFMYRLKRVKKHLLFYV